MGDAPSAGRRLVKTLADLKVAHYYTVPGESFLEVLEAARVEPSVSLISCRHESGASFMAEADAKLSGTPAVAAATRAPGAANLAIGVHTALHDSTPMIALLGQVDAGLLGCDAAFQGIDLEAFFRPITKWVATLRIGDDAAALARAALAAATSGRPGPAAIVLPSDVLAEPAPSDGGAPGTPSPVRSGADDETSRALFERLSRAERPVVVVGGRAGGRAAALVDLAERLGLGVYSAFRRQDRFPNDHPAYLGHLTIVTSPALLHSLENADVVVVLGARLSEITTQGFKVPSAGAYFVHIDAAVDPIGPCRAPDLAVAADVAATISRLAELCRELPRRQPPEHVRSGHQAYLEASEPPAPPPGGAIHPAEVVSAMVDALPADAIVASDAGNFSIFLHRFWRYRHAFSQLAATSGAMGYAVPAAVAAGRWRPERLAVAVAGDGGYLMTGQEIETAVRYGVKLVVVVMRNGLYGTIAMHQARAFGALAGVDIGDADLAAHARSLGAEGLTVTDRGELREALRAAAAAPGPVVVDAVVDPDVVSPELRLSEIESAAPGDSR